MQWDNIIGHEENIRMLRQLLTVGRMPHAWLFCGPEGIGKQKSALALAGALLCETKRTEACGSCFSCRQVAAGSHPDLMVVKAEGNAIKIEQIRNLQHGASRTAYSGSYRVFIIDDAELMTVQAANSLLKILEEPAEGMVFILVSSRRYNLLETIISRCRVLSFASLPYHLLAEELAAQGVSADKAQTAARLSGGSMGTAMELAKPEGLELRDTAAAVTANLTEAGIEDIWSTVATWEKMDKRRFLQMLRFLTCIFRDLLVCNYQLVEMLFNFDLTESLQHQAPKWSEKGLIQALGEIETARESVQANANLRLTCEALLLKLNELAKEI